jgi:putative acetyltransferase
MATELDLVLRSAAAHDLGPARDLVAVAFQANGPATAEFLDALRADGCVLGEWIAEDASGMVGHVAFSRVWLETTDVPRRPAVILTPMAVRPDRQRMGIGTRLMQHALRQLEMQGETLFFVLGHPKYYRRAGFSTAAAAGVESPWTGNPAFMARAEQTPRGRLVLPRVIADAP